MGMACGMSTCLAHHSAKSSRTFMLILIAPVEATPINRAFAHLVRQPFSRAATRIEGSISHKAAREGSFGMRPWPGSAIEAKKWLFSWAKFVWWFGILGSFPWNGSSCQIPQPTSRLHLQLLAGNGRQMVPHVLVGAAMAGSRENGTPLWSWVRGTFYWNAVVSHFYHSYMSWPVIMLYLHTKTCYIRLHLMISYDNISLHSIFNKISQNGCNPRIAREQNLSLWPWKNYFVWEGRNLAYFGLRRYIYT